MAFVEITGLVMFAARPRAEYTEGPVRRNKPPVQASRRMNGGFGFYAGLIAGSLTSGPRMFLPTF